MAKTSRGKGGGLHLEIPLDASGVEDFKPDKPVKVALVSGQDTVVASDLVKLSARGQGTAVFELDTAPRSLRIVVGPGDADDDELVRLQTISRELSPRALRQPRLELEPVVISSYYWWWWRRWCRTFTVRGRVVCPDGSPVPGAEVCAFDVDWWWWWSSSQKVGCATTDANGAFEITFRWCCGWWPWWWWHRRHWQLEPALVDRITPLLEEIPLPRPPVPSPKPSLSMFEELVAEDGVARVAPGTEIDVTTLPQLREELLHRLPPAVELEQLRVWPWWPWQPWWDCTPDLIFEVTQRCDGEDRVIVDEGFWDVRWNVPTDLVVTLTATDDACCIHEPPPPEGNCMVIGSVCDDVLDTIGGNPGAAPAPVGYLNPGALATAGDRAYAGTVPISGLFGSAATVDFYELEMAGAPGGPWSPIPPGSAGGFNRRFWGPGLPVGPVDFHTVPFQFQPVDGRLVVESREHFEAHNAPASWGTSRFWVSNRDLLLRWLTASTIADGTHYLRVAGYQEVAPGQLGPKQILPLCNTQDPNGVAITIDNSTSALEPAADVVSVRINGTVAGPCSNFDASAGGVLEVDFVAYDVDEHLAFYSLYATYDKNLAVNLLLAPGATLTPIAIGPIPAADLVGPNYHQARLQGATAPHWRAGGLRLTIPDLRDAFPETCCYQIELWVYKRTVVSCDHGYWPRKHSFYSLTVAV
jgi:hypothetical protein